MTLLSRTQYRDTHPPRIIIEILTPDTDPATVNWVRKEMQCIEVRSAAMVPKIEALRRCIAGPTTTRMNMDIADTGPCEPAGTVGTLIVDTIVWTREKTTKTMENILCLRTRMDQVEHQLNEALLGVGGDGWEI